MFRPNSLSQKQFNIFKQVLYFQDEKSVLEFLFNSTVRTENIAVPYFGKIFNKDNIYHTMAFENWTKIDFQENSNYTLDIKFSLGLSHTLLTS